MQLLRDTRVTPDAAGARTDTTVHLLFLDKSSRIGQDGSGPLPDALWPTKG